MKKITLLDFDKNRKRKTKRWLGWLTFCMMLFSGQYLLAQTNIADYQFTKTTGNTYVDLGTDGTVFESGNYDNQVSTAITMGGTFPFGGANFTTCYISANGFITFTAAPSGTLYTPLSTSNANGTIAAYAQDAGGTVDLGSEIRYHDTGTEFVVQYKNHSNYFTRTNGESLNFQIRLTYATGEINIVYGNCITSNTNSSTSGTTATQVGIRGNSTDWATNVNNLMLSNVPTGTACTWADVVSGNANNSSMFNNWGTATTSNQAITIPNGLKFTWTPQSGPSPVRVFDAVSDITDNGASLSWTAPTAATEYNIRYRAVGSCSWTNFIGNPVNTNSVTLTGLNANTSYQIQVQSYDGTNNSIWSHIPNTVGTGNGYVAAGTFTTAMLACTGTPDAGAISGTTVRPTCGGSAPSPTTATVTGYTTGVSGITFQWESSLDNLTWIDATGTGNGTITYTIPTHITGQTEYYRLRVTCSTSGLYSYSDVLQVTDPTAPDTQATNVGTSALGNTTASVTWTNGNGNRRFVVINTTNSFTDPVNDSGAALTATAAYTGSGEQIVYDGTGTSVTVTGLSPVTTYYVRVYEYRRCGSSAPFTYYYQTATETDNPGSFTTALYCTPTGAANNSDEILNFTLNNLNNSSTPSSGTAGYTNYSGTVSPAEIEIGVPATASLTSGSGSGNHGAAIWIDYNQNGVFDTDEKVAWIGNTIGASATVSFPAFIVPNTVTPGIYRLRVMYRHNASGETFAPCVAGTTYAEIEDYSVEILPTPPCLAPTDLTATDITYDSAVLGWASAGTLFDIEIVEEGETPTGTPTYTGVTNDFETTIDLSPSTSYEFYVRQDCDANGESSWTGPFSFTTECLPPSITETLSGEACGQGEVVLSATADAGATIAWYADETGGSVLGTGATFTTPLITETTSYWVEASEQGGIQNAGKPAPNATSTGFSTNNWGIQVTVNEVVTLESVTVYSTSAGTLNVKITDGAGAELYETGNINISAGGVGTPNIIPLNYNATAGNYRILVKSYTGVNLIRDSSGLAFPYTGDDGAVSVTASEWGGATTTSYYFFYDLKYIGRCSSARTEVVATVTTAPDLVLNETTVDICEGESTDTITITAGDADYDTYVWEPLTGVSGDPINGWIFNPTQTTTYILTVSQSEGNCATSVEVAVTVNDLPVISGITTNAIEICEGTSIELNASIPASPYCSVSFTNDVEPITLVEISNISNSTSATVNGTPDLEDFTSIVGNLEAGTTYPIILNGNTAGNYTNNFYVYIDWNQNGVFTDPGETYSVGNIINNTGSGTPLTGSIAVPASALNGNTRMRVLKKFSASTNPGSCNSSGYGQAEDYTVNITGGVEPDEFSWSDGTSVVSTESSLTVTPTTTTTYTVTVTNGSGCTATESVVVTVNPIPEEPVVACYEIATFNQATCQWEVTGEQPEEPVVACYQTATFNEVTCEWEVTGEQPEEPVVACYETATFNEVTCEWDVTGEQPEEPVVACYETATFNEVTCEWDVTGEQPEAPVVACYETATFNELTCEWDITGEQPEAPVVACYEIATFNELTCEWDITGEQPEEPVVACYQTATFNEVTCEWDVTGEQPAAPIADSPQSITTQQTILDIIVGGQNLTWYSDSMLTTIIDETFEFTEGSYTFWVTQTIDGCESDAIAIEVEVTLNRNDFDNASFRTYPNPVKDYFNVSYNKEITSISVVNMLGQTVIEKAVNTTDTQIDMTLLPTGSYFVKVTVEGSVKTIKVIKQ